jgi:hypothetical protein
VSLPFIESPTYLPRDGNRRSGQRNMETDVEMFLLSEHRDSAFFTCRRPYGSHVYKLSKRQRYG